MNLKDRLLLNEIQDELVLGGFWQIRTSKKLQASGLVLPDVRVILVNPDFTPDEIEITVIHEMLHYLKPNWKEELVEKTAKRLWQEMPEKQKMLMKLIVQALSKR